MEYLDDVETDYNTLLQTQAYCHAAMQHKSNYIATKAPPLEESM